MAQADMPTRQVAPGDKPEEIRNFFYDELFQDGRLWRIEWLGQIIQNPGDRSNPLIELVVAPLLLDPEGLDANDAALAPDLALAVRREERMVVHHDVATLLDIPIGSLWLNGKPWRYPGYEVFRAEELSFGKGYTHSVRLDSLELDAAGIILDDYVPLDTDLPTPIEKGHLLAVQVGSDPYGLLIPMPEVVRFYFCQSSFMAKLLIRSPFGLNEDKIYDVDHSGLRDDGVCYVERRKEVGEEDMHLIVHLLTKRWARIAANKIWLQRLKNKQNEGYGSLAAFPPFPRPATIIANGAWLGGPETSQPRFLAFRIAKGNFPPPHEVNGIEEAPDARNYGHPESGPPIEEEGEKKPQYGGRPKKPKKRQPYRKDLEPDKNRQTFKHEVSGGGFLDKLDIKKVNKRPEKPSIRRPWKRKEEPAYLAGGDGSSIDTDAGRLMFGSGSETDLPGSRERRPTIPADFDTFLNIVEHIKHLGASARIVPASVETASHPTGPRSFFPLKVGGRDRKWPRIDDGDTVRARQLMVVELEYKERYFYFMEVERRKAGVTYTEKGYSMLLLYDHDLSPMNTDTFKEFLDQCSRKRGWPPKSYFDGGRFGCNRFPHSYAEGNESRCADNVFAAMNEMTKPASPDPESAADER